MSENKEDSADNNAMNFLKSARDAAFLFAVFLYFMGWIYIYVFMDSFGLSIKSVDVDIYNLLIYSSNVFIYIYNYQKIFIFFVLILFIVIRLYKKISSFLYKLIPVFIIILFPVTYYFAKSAAESNAQAVLLNPARYLKSIQFTFKDIKSDTTSYKGKSLIDEQLRANNNERIRILTQNNKGAFRLIVSNKDEYSVLQVDSSSKPNSPNIYSIKKDMVEFAFIVQ